MIGFICQVGLTGIRYLDKLIRKAGKQELEQEAARQVLQVLVRVAHLPVLRHIAAKKIFILFYLPDTEPGVIVDLLLKKNRHKQNFRFGIADFRYKLAKLSVLVTVTFY